jgi:hypothetical protein
MELLGALAAIRMMDRRDGAEVRGQMPAAKGGRIGCFDAHHKASDAPTLERLPLQSTSQADLPARGADRIRSILYSFLSFFSKTLSVNPWVNGGVNPGLFNALYI